MSKADEGASQRMVRVGRISVDLERTAQQTRRIFESALLQPDDTQAKQGIEIAVVGLKHDCIKLLRLQQTALTME